MSKGEKVLFMLFVALITIGGLCIILPSLDDLHSYFSKQNEERAEMIQQCEHEYVIASEYNFFIGAYKTISKCVKCGRVVR